ncbi:AfsR/SARP family transcriptional regulator [Streptomyces sp. NBC_00414]|uniref:BTAD domain-containing putative transcriptional regulator n=1 Tax=Streptomyces sp. NBC_00414 TaxID=2975739 RepID=UPI002E242C0D
MEDGDARLRIALLGALQVSASRGGAALPVPGARSQGLLVRLALAGGHPVAPRVLVDAIWAEDPPADPAHALQALVSRLRRSLGSAGLLARAAGGYRLDVAATDVDALRFERLAAAGRDRLRAGDPRTAAAVLGEALALWGDRPGAGPTVVAAVAPAAATRLAHTSVEAVTDLAEAELALNHADMAATRLTALLAEHPLHERAAALLMDALAAQGRQAEALALYERVRETLADDLGTGPGTALRERHLRLLRAERPTQAAAAAQSGPGNLPAPLTSFIGRDDDLARIESLLAAGRLVTVVGPGGAGKTRLAVEAARRHRHAYRDGAWLADLAPVTEPAKAGAALLAAIGLRGGAVYEARTPVYEARTPVYEARTPVYEARTPVYEARTPVSEARTPVFEARTPVSEVRAQLLEARTRVEDDDVDVLVDRLGGREILLLVDNCEHLIDAVAHLVAALLPRCPGLRVLATSREPLAVDGEALVPLGPLAPPGPDDGVARARSTASVRLFAERAAAVRPGFEVDGTTLPEVRHVVRALDGMPLALELAAARLRTLSLPELADGLSDRFGLLTTGSRTSLPRHRTLRAVIAWSWDLLSEDERTVAERVSVLPGGVTPASAAALCAGTAVPAAGIPGLLAALVDRSLLHLGPVPGRYRMLETLREYGTDRLAGTGDLGAVRDLAADHFAELMARADPRLRGPGRPAAMRVVGAEYDNTLAALRRRCDRGDASGAIALVLHLTWYWQMLGRHSEAAHRLGEALAVPGGEPTPDRDCARAIHLLNRVVTRPGATAEESAADRAGIREASDRLLAYPELPGPYGALAALPLAFLRGEGAAVPALVGRLADGDDVWLSGLARLFRAQFAENAGELDKVRTDVEAALACFRQVGDHWGLADALPMRARLRQYDDDLDGALADLCEAGVLAGEFGSLSLADEVFGGLRRIDLHLRRGDTDLVIATIDSARERALRLNSPETLFLVDGWEAVLRLRLGDLSRAGALLDKAEQGLYDGPSSLGDISFSGDLSASGALSASGDFSSPGYFSVSGVPSASGGFSASGDLSASRGLSSPGVPPSPRAHGRPVPHPPPGDHAFPGDHARALVGSARASLCLETGDPAGAQRALAKAYAAALATGDLPNLSLVAVTVAALAEALGRHHAAAVLLGAAARLRGAHDRTDRQVRDLTRRGRAALGGEAFAEAYAQGWDLDGKSAVTEVDPARLSREQLS